MFEKELEKPRIGRVWRRIAAQASSPSALVRRLGSDLSFLAYLSWRSPIAVEKFANRPPSCSADWWPFAIAPRGVLLLAAGIIALGQRPEPSGCRGRD